jgi:alcohol dehydrogenase class IV
MAGEPMLQSLTGATHFAHGPGCARQLHGWLEPYAGRGSLVILSGRGLPGRMGPGRDLLDRLRTAFPASLHFALGGEPSDLWVDGIRQGLRGETVAAVISIGGGSVLDGGKALAALLTESGPACEFLEGVGTRTPGGGMLPWFALPTTAGTGSEASTNAVLGRPGPAGFKKSLRHPAYRATGILLDAELGHDLPPLWTAACGMDAITQLFESWSSTQVPPDLKPHLEQALLQAIPALPRLVEEGPAAPLGLRQQLLDAACLSGVGLTRAGLGTCHGLAGPVGAVLPIPHGIICARLMGPCLRETLDWLEAHPENPPGALDDFRRLFRSLRAGFADPLEEILSWADRFRIPDFSQWHPRPEDLDAILAQAKDRNSPAALGETVWRRLLTQAC